MKFCAKTRPFNSVEEMDEALISAWNNTIKPGDIVYHLGDFAMRLPEERLNSVFSRLMGDKHLITGNHDHREVRKLPWSSVTPYREIRHDDELFVLFHYPIMEWNGCHRGSYHLFGHVHGRKVHSDNVRALDVAIDSVGINPISIETVKKMLGKRPAFPHHFEKE